MGKLKNTLIDFQKEVSSATKEIDLEDEIISKNEKVKKDSKKNG